MYVSSVYSGREYFILVLPFLCLQRDLSLFTGGPVCRRTMSNAHSKHYIVMIMIIHVGYTQDPSYFFFVSGPFTS